MIEWKTKYRLVLIGAEPSSQWTSVSLGAENDAMALLEADSLLNHGISSGEITGYEGYQLIEVATGRIVGEDGQYGD